MQTFTYKEITRVAEEKISSFMADSERKSDSDAVSVLYLDWAVGAFFLWHEITGCQKSKEDEERLSKIVGISK